VDGHVRRVMIRANKNGFLYVLDRTNCRLIAAHPYVKVNWASHIDLETGRPVLTDVYKRFLAGEEVEIWPSRGTNAVPIAINPDTGVVSRLPEMKPGDVYGHLQAIHPLTGKKKWSVPLTDFPSSSGMLVTAGGLVFTGRLSGEFVALDEETGKTLWQFRTGSRIDSTAITYTHKGRQYVAGLGGGLANRYAAEKMPTGGSMWTFALMP
jgi:alcohol dehydrogenase (cytochrome c)